MKPGQIGYRILDKDLDRITHVEKAQHTALRPILRLGFAILLLAAVLVLAAGLTKGNTSIVAIGIGAIVAGWLGLAIGANDVSNSLGPAVGAGAIGIIPGLILVAIAEIAGASLAGGVVTHRLAGGLFDAETLYATAQAQTLMVSALVGAATWITLATGMGLPVSTSHSIVGAIAGAGMIALGVQGIHWPALIAIASVWVISPISAGLVAGVILVFVQRKIGDAENRTASARFWLPVLVGAMAGLFVAMLAVLVIRRTGHFIAPSIAVTLLAAVVAGWGMRQSIGRDVALGGKARMKELFRPPLLAAVVAMAFAHGANDVGNVAGPLSVIMTGGLQSDVNTTPMTVLLLAGLAIAVGTLFFGRRLVQMVGTGITRLNPVRAFCVSLATATTVLIASVAGLPVSTTHIAIGGIFGVGFAREWLDRKRTPPSLAAEEKQRRVLIRRSHVFTITAAWLVTVPVTALLGACCYFLFSLTNGA